jgi:low temperature requirement protein LtrA
MSVMETGTEGDLRSRRPRLGAAFRHEARVMPLELFFDLVFVLALTQ